MLFLLATPEYNNVQSNTTKVKVHLRSGVAEILEQHRDLMGKIDNNIVEIETNFENKLEKIWFVLQDAVFSESDVHPGLFHLAQGHDGAFEFSLDGAVKIHLFGELTSSEICAIKQFKTDPAGFGQSRRGHLDAQLIETFGRDLDRGSVIGQTKLNAHFAQTVDHRTGVFAGHVLEQRFEALFFVFPGANQDARDEQDGDDTDDDALPHGQPQPQFPDLF